ncbi:MAG: hypothetical protein BWY02_02859 [bacterium ADurb.Bin157]|nr:MAG: hypothetical protein BWY02_02859 [bacterium ADurb.Bin157]
MEKTKKIEEIEEFDKVLLKTGEIAYVVEIYGGGEAFEADIDKPNGKIETDMIWPKDIDKVFKKSKIN